MRIDRPNLGIYLRAVPLLLSHPSILIAPVVATIAAVLLEMFGQWLTDPIGGVGADLYGFLGRILVLMSLGVAIVHARDILHGYAGTFDDAWSEARRKLGGLFVSAFGFTFFVDTVARIIGGALAGLSPYTWVLLPATVLLVIYLCIYMMPAAAIGGAPGVASLERSYRLALRYPLPAMVLTAAWWLLTYYVPTLLGGLYAYIPAGLTQFAAALIGAILVAYLAFALAAQYEDVA